MPPPWPGPPSPPTPPAPPVAVLLVIWQLVTVRVEPNSLNSPPPSATGKTTASPRHGAAPTPDGSIAPARDDGSDQQPGQPPARTPTAGEHARLADCPADCPGS